MSDSEPLNWYALKVFFNRVRSINDSLLKAGYETYMPVTYRKTGEDEEGMPQYKEEPLASLLFLKTTAGEAIRLRGEYFGKFLFYDHRDSAGKSRPSPISEREMALFRKVTAVRDPKLEYMNYDPQLYASGKKVRITGGPFAGAEGVIKRIRHDRRFLIEIKGICLVATSYIPQSMTEPIEEGNI